MRRRGSLGLALALVSATRLAGAHHAGGAEESLGLLGYRLGGVLLVLAALAGWALFGAGGRGDDDLSRPDR